MKKGLVFLPMIGDFIHKGHINTLNKASELGEVIVGLYTIEAISEMKETAFLKYSQREEVILALSNVSKVVPQKKASLIDTLIKLKPNYLVHGDDWKQGNKKKYRDEVVTYFAENIGELIEVEYTKGISDSGFKSSLAQLGITGMNRIGRLRQLLAQNKTIHVLEAHNALSALVAEKLIVERDGINVSFDALWSSSLTDSTSKGKPDIEVVDLTSRLNMVNEILEVTTKPIIYDADTGGKIEHFELTVKSLERTGISAVVIEDKTGLKKNSLLGNDVIQSQDTIENFSNKIICGKNAQLTDDFMIIARVESLILEKGMNDALKRAFSYVDAGANGIMIHSRKKDPTEIFEFVHKFRDRDITTPLVVVPTSFNTVKINEFSEKGVNIVIAANHMLRSSYPAMLNVAKSILKNGRTLEAEPMCMSIKDILNFIPGTK